MKNKLFQIFALSMVLMLASSLVSFKNKTPKTIKTEFTVYGCCGDCKERIENALDTKGVVISKKNPVEGVLVYWKNYNSLFTKSDSLGKFTIAKPDSSYADTLMATMLGFEPKVAIVKPNQSKVVMDMESNTMLQDAQVGTVGNPKRIDARNPRQITRFSEREFTKAACCNLSERTKKTIAQGKTYC
jgi:hypothetical protein